MKAPESGPLQGIRVVAIEQSVAGPLCTRHLADLGAEVIKVERPGSGDMSRYYDSMVKGFASHFVWVNRGKRSLGLDLKRPQGLQVLCDLLRTADVFVSNLGPGALARLVSDEKLNSLNPRLVVCVISAYGPDGPYKSRKGYDLLIQGEAGVTRSTGTTEVPAKPGVSLADLSGAAYALAVINASLVERSRTGVGRRVEIALFDVVAEWMMPLLLAQRYTGKHPSPSGMRHATITPYGPFETADGVTVNIAVQTDGQWRRLCLDVLHDGGLLDDERYRTIELRLEHREALEAIIRGAFRQFSYEDLRLAVEAADVPWGLVNDVPEVVNHPQLVERNRWINVELPDGNEAEVLADPFLIGATTRQRKRIPGLGENTHEILKELGYTEAAITDLEKAGAIQSEHSMPVRLVSDQRP